MAAAHGPAPRKFRTASSFSGGDSFRCPVPCVFQATALAQDESIFYYVYLSFLTNYCYFYLNLMGIQFIFIEHIIPRIHG